MLVHQCIARGLADLGVDTLFGLIGDANLYMVDCFRREHAGRYVSAVHEANALLMALGYAQASGRVGVATVTHGPGLVNALPALIEGVKGTIPGVLICGEVPVEDRYNRQRANQRELILATGAGLEQVRAPSTAPEDLAVAFRRAVLERRPVVLNTPTDFQWKETEYRTVALPLADDRAATPLGDGLDNAVGIVVAARRPVVLAGRGAADPRSRDALVRLAARIGAPLATTLKAKGLFAGEPHDLGVFGTLSTPVAVETILAADCVLVFGAGLNRFTTSDRAFLRGGLAEFSSAVRHRLDLISVICNDGSYGAEHVQFRNKQMDPSLSMFDWPDFAPVAAALGGSGVTVRGTGDLDSMEAAVAGRDRPLLIDLKLDPDCIVY